MKKNRKAVVIAALLLLVGPGALPALENYQYPAIQGYGPIVPLPRAVVQPDGSLTYKVLFDITTAGTKKDKAGTVNDGLGHVARFINVMKSAGPSVRQELVIVIHGSATPVVLDNRAYKAKFNQDNPNRQLIKDLKSQGVTIYVCGQALRDHKFTHDSVNPDISIALSALVVVPTYQLKGYAYQPFF